MGGGLNPACIDPLACSGGNGCSGGGTGAVDGTGALGCSGTSIGWSGTRIWIEISLVYNEFNTHKQ
jgi:hypothetical protein